MALSDLKSCDILIDRAAETLLTSPRPILWLQKQNMNKSLRMLLR